MKITELTITEIYIAKDRQRQDLGDIEELRTSIRNRAGDKDFKHGLLSPIIVQPTALEGFQWELVAGERRLRAHEAEGAPTIFGREFSDLDAYEAKLIEYEENVRRKDLHWTEQARAV